MPKETVHWGKHYKLVKHEATENTGEWFEEYNWDGGYQTDDQGKALPLPPNTQASRYPSVEIVWTRAEERAPVAYDEIAEGFVQLGLRIDAVDMEHYRRYHDGSEKDTTYYTRALSRTEINNMIKTLKRARDAAYGEDQ